VFYRGSPGLKKRLKDGSIIEVILGGREIAVGYQAMIYLCIPLKNTSWGTSIRSANEREYVRWKPKLEHIENLIMAFSIASRTFKNDLIRLLRDIINRTKC